MYEKNHNNVTLHANCTQVPQCRQSHEGSRFNTRQFVVVKPKYPADPRHKGSSDGTHQHMKNEIELEMKLGIMFKINCMLRTQHTAVACTLRHREACMMMTRKQCPLIAAHIKVGNRARTPIKARSKRRPPQNSSARLSLGQEYCKTRPSQQMATPAYATHYELEIKKKNHINMTMHANCTRLQWHETLTPNAAD